MSLIVSFEEALEVRHCLERLKTFDVFAVSRVGGKNTDLRAATKRRKELGKRAHFVHVSQEQLFVRLKSVVAPPKSWIQL
jgi:hypothetical protein